MAEATVSTTQRAYTLKLSGVTTDDHEWRDALWRTHEAINKGAKVFGDWLLTLRGGICHTSLAEMPEKKGALPDNTTIRNRRILLALSWLSVESQRGAPEDRYIVAYGDSAKDTRSQRQDKVIAAFREILAQRGLEEGEIDAWTIDCQESLKAEIRPDAVWVNRSDLFDKAIEEIGDSLNREEVWDILDYFFVNRESYLKSMQIEETENNAVIEEEKAKDLVQKAGNWLSTRFGGGTGADYNTFSRVYHTIAEYAEYALNNKSDLNSDEFITGLCRKLELPGVSTQSGRKLPAGPGVSFLSADDYVPTKRVISIGTSTIDSILSLLSGPGYKSGTKNLLRQLASQKTVTINDLTKLRKAARKDEDKSKLKVGNKGPRPWSDIIMKNVAEYCGCYYSLDGRRNYHGEFSVMLDHAARRVSLAHTWIKRAEAQRQKFDEEAAKLKNVPSEAQDWLDNYCQERSGFSGADLAYLIRPKAVKRWTDVLKAWKKHKCQTEEHRIEIARSLQEEFEDFGDIQLFEALARKDAQCVRDDKGEILADYVRATNARHNQNRFKVPAYRHPDMLRHPIFCEYGDSRFSIKYDIHELFKSQNKSNHNPNQYRSDGLQMSVIGENGIIFDQSLSLHSKRFYENIIKSAPVENARFLKRNYLWIKSLRPALPGAFYPIGYNHTLGRNDRLGRAAVNGDHQTSRHILPVFRKDKWNGRLQASRKELDCLAHYVDKNGWNAVAERLKNKINWFISFSPGLEPHGPWLDYVGSLSGRNGETYKVKWDTGKDAWKFFHQNKDDNRLRLARLPGLRVLSVDLGHRFAASCAVWETLSPEALADLCRSNGQEMPGGDGLYSQVIQKGQNGKKDKKIILRQIGPDKLPDGTPHPAPWARLDRQFIIKLQGEDKVRMAGPAEMELFKSLCQICNLSESFHEPFQKDVDIVMSQAVNHIRLALRHHGQLARLAHNMTAKAIIKPGGREVGLDEEGQNRLINTALADWREMAGSRKWDGTFLRRLWNQALVPLGAEPLTEPLTDMEEDKTRQQRRKEREHLESQLKGVSEKLWTDKNLRESLHKQIADEWSKRDQLLQKQVLRPLRNWLLPNGSRRDGSIRHTGGLSLKRIATIKSLYQVQKAFAQRPRPDNLRAGIADKGDHSIEGFGRKILAQMEKLREQRVKQLASRIVEAALGIGKEGGKKRPDRRVYAPCHAVVIENLQNYRPDQLQTRRENRQLMTWSSSKVKKFLEESCFLNGLMLREVPAAYTSRQDSRTGKPGLRCVETPLQDFLTGRLWLKKTATARRKIKEKKASPIEKYLVELADSYKEFAGNMDKIPANLKPLRLPRDGGDLFVSSDDNSPLCGGIQADLNAAANIGLQALLDPDWPGRFWRIPCTVSSGKPKADFVKGSQAIDPGQPLAAAAEIKPHAAGDTVNLWRDPSVVPLDGAADWRPTKTYWRDVEEKVVKILSEFNNKRLAAVYPEPDNPF